MKGPFLVLHNHYIPSLWRPRVIGEELTRITHEAGLKPHSDFIHGAIHWKKGWYSDPLHAEVRFITIDAPAAEGWHQDGDTTPGANMDCALVVWANRTPTEFLFKGEVFQPPPFSLVIARNLGCQHRRPAGAPKRRWMFRQRVAVPKGWGLP